MQYNKDYQYYFLIYISFSAIFFIVGLTICYFIPYGSSVYTGFHNSLTENLKNSSPLSLPVLASAFAKELKFILFSLVAAFTPHKNKLFPVLISYKSILMGYTTSFLIREIKFGHILATYETIGIFLFVLLMVGTVCVLCRFCSVSLIYSSKIIYPPRFQVLLRRKDTYIFLLDFLACCGLLFLLIFLKQGDLYIMFS